MRLLITGLILAAGGGCCCKTSWPHCEPPSAWRLQHCHGGYAGCQGCAYPTPLPPAPPVVAPAAPVLAPGPAMITPSAPLAVPVAPAAPPVQHHYLPPPTALQPTAAEEAPAEEAGVPVLRLKKQVKQQEDPLPLRLQRLEAIVNELRRER